MIMKMVLRLVLAGGIVLGVTGPVPLPAVAAPGVALTTYLMNVTVAPGSEENYTSLYGSFPRSAASGQARRVSYSVDLSAVAGFARLIPREGDENIIVVESASESPYASPCTGPGPVLSCTTVLAPRTYVVPMGLFEVLPTAAAQPGDAGEVVVTARVEGGPTTTSSSRVRIGQGVDLATSGTTQLTVRPGGTTSYRPEVSNVGAVPVDGVVLYVSAEPAWLAGTSFTNCTYGDAVVCTFDTTLAPGVSYIVSAPMRLHAPDDAASGSEAQGVPQWLTPAVWEDWQDTFPGSRLGRSGTGSPLELLPRVTAAVPPQVDDDATNEEAAFALTVTGASHPDLVAVGARIDGRTGERLAVRVGLVNRGPGTLYPRLFVNNSVMVSVDLPAGLTVIRADTRCSAWWTTDAGSAYGCWMRPDPLQPGRSALFDFTLAVTDRYEGRAGRVRLEAGPPLENRRSTANNTAEVLVKLPKRGLPITGTGVGVFALALLTIGAAGLLLARRS